MIRHGNAYQIRRNDDLSRVPVLAIIDDDDGVRDALFDLIRSVGFRAQLFTSGEDYLRTRDINEIDVILSDFSMPGMSGLELQRRLNTEAFCPPFILMTSLSDERIGKGAIAAGAVGFLQKPFEAQALVDHLNSVLRLG